MCQGVRQLVSGVVASWSRRGPRRRLSRKSCSRPPFAMLLTCLSTTAAAAFARRTYSSASFSVRRSASPARSSRSSPACCSRPSPLPLNSIFRVIVAPLDDIDDVPVVVSLNGATCVGGRMPSAVSSALAFEPFR